MSGAHDEKLIAEKYAIDYPRRPLATRLWKSRWNWLAFFAACLVGVALYFVQGNAAFWAGPVSHSHASFAMDCQKCHAESWQPALRLASLDSGRHSVPDSACRQCHPTVGDHHPRVGEIEPSCASCHQEHQQETPLLEVADNHCASCHGSATALYGGPDVEPHFQAEIVTFDDGPQGHPDFAFFFGGPVSKVHGAFRVAAPDNDGKWHDTGGVLFNHKVHLAAEGVLDGNRKKVQLACADCHEPEADGAYMKPIVYEQHCSSCHPLRLAGELTDLGDLPHENPEVVRGVIRERLAQPKTEPTAATPVPVIRRLPQPSTLTQTENASADTLLAAADHAVFGLEAKGLCRKCHHVEITDGRWTVPLVNPEFGELVADATREMIPSRWFAHGQFHHAKHLSVECEQCHRAGESSSTSDLLLPGIADCRKCHGSNPATIATGVSAECVMCHDYHFPAKHPPTETALLTFFEQGAKP
jgi:hypothetical protein